MLGVALPGDFNTAYSDLATIKQALSSLDKSQSGGFVGQAEKFGHQTWQSIEGKSPQEQYQYLLKQGNLLKAGKQADISSEQFISDVGQLLTQVYGQLKQSTSSGEQSAQAGKTEYQQGQHLQNWENSKLHQVGQLPGKLYQEAEALGANIGQFAEDLIIGAAVGIGIWLLTRGRK